MLGLLALGACAHPDQKLVRRVRLDGVRSLRKAPMLMGLETRRTAWWPFAEKHYYDPALLDRDVRRIEAHYARSGFFAARVVQRQVKQRPGGRAVDVRLRVDEGQPTMVREVVLKGLERLDARQRSRLREGLGLASGKRFDHDRYRRATVRLKQELIQSGRAYARVTGRVEVDRKARTARIVIDAAPGPLVCFGETTLEGNGAIPGDKLVRLATWERGDRYDPDEINRTRARLFNQRLFASVSVDLPSEPTREAAVRIRVVPTKLREVRLGVGLGVERQRQEVRLSGRWTLRNFLGGMRTLEVQLRPAYVAYPTVWAAKEHGPAAKTDVRLSQPDAWGSGLTLFAVNGYDLGIEQGYQYHGPRVQLGADRTFVRDHLRAGLSWNLQFLDFFNTKELFDQFSTPLGVGFRDPYRLAWLEEFLRLDLRDNIVDPQAGLLGEVRLEQGFPQIGGQFTYFKVVPDLRGYIPVFTRRLVLALRVQLGYMRPLVGDETPVTRRIALGGPTSHRGFTFGRLSPQQNGIPYGGNGSLLGSADLRLRMFQLFKSWISLVPFFDAGDAVADFQDLSLAKLHLATGGSLEYQTPIGSIRVGIGVRLNRLGGRVITGGEPAGNEPVNPDPGERLAFHLTIGDAF